MMWCCRKPTQKLKCKGQKRGKKERKKPLHIKNWQKFCEEIRTVPRPMRYYTSILLWLISSAFITGTDDLIPWKSDRKLTWADFKSKRSEEHTSELQSHSFISYAF